MLTKIDRIEGTGLFADAGPSVGFERVTMVFGENGRGKSTLAALLRSCAENDGASLRARATLGQVREQRATLSFLSSAGASRAVLDAGTWDRPIPDMIVFDAEFVARNVYAGQEISSDHRASLLDFSLGEEAVTARAEHDSYAEPLRLVNVELRNATAAIDAKRGAIRFDDYRDLPNDADADAQLEVLERRLQAALAIDAVRARPMGADIVAPTFDLDSLFLILRKSLPMIEAQAEARVKEHIAKNAGHGFEAWVSSGLEFVTAEVCPFCEGDIAQSTLIAAYRAHFNEEYQTLKKQAAELVRGVEHRLQIAHVDRLERDLQLCQAQQNQWAENLAIQGVALDGAGLKERFGRLRELLVPLATAKSHAPLDSIGSADDEVAARTLWSEVTAAIGEANAQIKTNREAISAYKAGLENSNVAQLRALIAKLEAAKYRHSQQGVQQIETLDAATAEKARLTAAKDAARVRLDDLMTQTFDRYSASINALLEEFGSQIRVRDLAISYRGGQNRPRTEYALEVRGAAVLLAGGQGPNFGTSLSEGDKRALAFAFFIARVLNDAGLQNRIVVIDDPMCSLDRTRKATTLRTLKRLAGMCRQLIVLAHDIWFLRDLDDGLEKLPTAVRPARAYAKISRAANDLSSFSDLDIGLECQSDYQRNLSDVGGYARGVAGLDKQLVAKSLRPLVEGYMKRRFPLDIPRTKNLGDILRLIRDSQDGDPLGRARVLLEDLQAINDFTIPFMHVEGEPAPDLSAIDEGELAAFSARGMRVVYG